MQHPVNGVAGRSQGRRAARKIPSGDILAGCVLVALGVAGGEYGFSTLPMGLGLAIATLALSLALRRPRTLRLLDIWWFAFIYLFGSEVFGSLWDVREDFGVRVSAEAEGFVVAAFGASLAGYGVGRFLLPLRPIRAPVPARRGSATLFAALVVLSTFIVLYLAIGVSPGQLLAMRARDAAIGPAFPAVATAMVVQCALVAQVLATTRCRAAHIFPLATTVLSFAVLYLVGTRFFLGFFVSSVVFYVTRFMEPLSRRRLAILCVMVVALAAAQGTMRFVRGAGIAGANSDRVTSSLTQAGTYLSSEGMLRVHAWVHEKQVYADSGHAAEHAFLLYWWVPRALWPSKPTMDGYWLAHEVMADGDVGAGHSVAGGFALPSLLDFGPHLGVLVCFVYGLGLWALELFMTRHRAPSDSASVFSALLPFAIFFAMRSPQTSTIFLESCVALYLPIFCLDRIGARRRRRVARRVVVGGAVAVTSGGGPRPALALSVGTRLGPGWTAAPREHR